MGYHPAVTTSAGLRRAAGLLPILISVSLIASGQSPQVLPYLDPDRSPAERAHDLVSRMTLDQKVRQMQHNAPAIPELRVPAYNWWNEALHGVARAGRATVFPQAIGLAATFDTDLMFRVADVISTEARAKYHEAIRQDIHAQYYGLTFWSPNINIFRDPRWGRGQETYGEDPFLAGRLAVAFIKGMQGDDPRYFKVIATAKHFAVHSGPESTRHSADVVPTPDDLERTYLPAFRAAIVEGHADSVMCAYNRVDGVPACVSTALLQTRLRRDWGFDGYVVSDCGAIRDIYNATAHHYVPTAGEASAAAVKAGTDLTCGQEYTSLVGAVGAGQITEAEIDGALVRLFTARFKLGMFDPPDRVAYSTIPYSVVDSPAHRALALEAARKSIVLLENDRQALPLRSSVRTIAIVGPSADDPVAPLGNYNGYSLKHVTPYDGIHQQYGGRAQVRYALGSTYVADRPVVIATSVLTTGSAFERGVRAEYFDNADLQGRPRLTRTESRPSIWPATDPALAASGLPARGYSIRWIATLTAPVSGEYAFSASDRNANVRIFLDDRELTRPTEPAQPGAAAAPAGRGRGQPPPTPVRLERARRYGLRVEYRPSAGRGGGFNAPGAVDLLWLPPAEPLLAEARDVISQSDVAIAFVGLNPSLEGEEMSVNVPGFRGGDRTDLELPAPQEALLATAFATGKPVIVVLTSGSAVAIRSAADRAAAVVAAWYGGEEIGTAIADTLSGANNPGGRLPVTFYRGVDQLPPFEDYAMKGRTYRYFEGEPLYRFGFGLSYSTFEYSDLRAEPMNGGFRVTARVRNTSARDGDEVVQLYVGGGTDVSAPVRELRGVMRAHLRAGESRDVTFTVPDDRWLAGDVSVSVGGGQPVEGTAFVTKTIARR